MAPGRGSISNSPESLVSWLDESNHLARTALSSFFQKGIGSSDWHVFRSAHDFRFAYVGTMVSNLSHLAGMRHSQDASAQPRGDITPNTREDVPWQQSGLSTVPQNHGPSLPLHYPYPQIRPLRDCGHQAQASAYTGVRLRPPHDMVSDLSSFPVQDIREALVKAYFKHIHPTFPLLTPSTFLRPDGSLRGSAPLLLYQAVLLVGAHACSHPAVERERSLLKSVLFRRASMLYHLRHEKDRLHLTQAALLFTWHINDGDTVAGGPWYWIGIAIRVSCAQGAHRHNPQLPTFERIMYKRTFWCVFLSEVFSALETGRPCAIRAEDIDQSRLSEAELQWDQRQDVLNGDSMSMQGPQVSLNDDLEPFDETPTLGVGNMQFLYHHHLVDLAFIAMEILNLNAPSATQKPNISGIQSQLAGWLLRSGLSVIECEEGYYKTQLRLYYNMAILKLHRNYQQDHSHSNKTCTAAAETIIVSLERIAALDAIARCHFPVVSAITAAGIQIVQDIRLAVSTSAYIVCTGYLQRLARVVNSTKLLARLWPDAEAVQKVFEGLYVEYEEKVSKILSPGETLCLSEAELDWDNIFASLQSTDIDQIIGEQDWNNLHAWAESL